MYYLSQRHHHPERRRFIGGNPTSKRDELNYFSQTALEYDPIRPK